MFLTGFDQGRHLIFCFRVHDQIRNAAKLSVLDRVHFFLGMSMAVPEAYFSVVVDLIRVQKLSDVGQKRGCLLRFRHERRIRGFVAVGRVKLDV